MAIADILRGVAHPNVYRTNAFRILGLAVDARLREINRRFEIIEAEEEGVVAKNPKGPLPLEPRPDIHTIRGAAEGLRDPVRRFIDEFLWLWPQKYGSSREDPALTALESGNVQEASNLWRHAEKSNGSSPTAKHNLAVLYHVLALDMEYSSRTRPLDAEQAKIRDQYWTSSLKRWRELWVNEQFLTVLSSRISEIADPQLTVEAAREVRNELPAFLVSINVWLALHEAEHGSKSGPKRHRCLIASFGFDERDIDQAYSRVLDQSRDTIKRCCETAEEKARSVPEQADQTAAQLFRDTVPRLSVLTRVLPPSHHLLNDAHDEVALKGHACIACFVDKTKNWSVAKELLELYAPLGASQSTKDRVGQDLDSLRNVAKLGLCWFCGENPMQDRALVEVKLCGNITRTPTFGGVQVNWQTGTIKVPRCQACQDGHARAARARDATAGLVALVGLVASVLIGLAASIYLGFGCFALSCIVAVGIGLAVQRCVLPEGIKPESHKVQWPEIKEMRKQGWEFGHKPSSVQ